MAATAPARAPRHAPRRTLRAGIFGVGAALPEQVVTNDDLTRTLDTSDEWIVKRTGIRTRHWLDEGQPVAPLAAEACLRALADAGREASEVDRIIITTLTPDRIMPSARAAGVDTSMIRPRTNGPRSLMRQRIERPADDVTVTTLPKGRVRWAHVISPR